MNADSSGNPSDSPDESGGPFANRRVTNPSNPITNKKPFVMLGDAPVWQHSARRFRAHPDVRQLILVIAEEDFGWVVSTCQNVVEELGIQLVVGGLERADSVENALNHIDSHSEFIAIHDAARPCLSLTLIDRVFQQARQVGAAIPVIPVHSTVKRSNDRRFIKETLDRSQLFLAQTPQVFRRDWILDAYSKRDVQAITDEAQLLEQLGYPVAMADGSHTNLKITLPEDLLLVEYFMKQGIE